MKYLIENEFPCDARTALETMFDECIGEDLLPLMTKITEVETLDWVEKDGIVTRRVRYLPVPAIRSVGTKKVDPKWMEWIEESEANLEAGTVKYSNVPTTRGVAKLLENRGEMRIVPLTGSTSKRTVTGELKVNMFLVGPIAERVIHSYAREILDEEATALTRLIETRES